MAENLQKEVGLIRVQRTGSSAFRCAVAETQGRRPSHEDAHSMRCDGMAADLWVLDGHRGDSVARFGAAALARELGGAVTQDGEFAGDDQIKVGFAKVDGQLLDQLREDPAARISGSTVVGALAARKGDGTYAVKLLNCGDSRGVLVWGPAEEEGATPSMQVRLPEHLEEYGRKSFGHEASWLPEWPAIVESIDHKPNHPTEKSRILAAGGRVSGRGRLNGQLAVSRGLGDFDFKGDRARPVAEQKVSCVPDIYETAGLPEGTLLILGCDGLWDSMSSEEAAEFVRERFWQDPLWADIGEIAGNLVELCIKRGSSDNITVMVAQFVDGSEWQGAPDEIRGLEHLKNQKEPLDDDTLERCLCFLRSISFPFEPGIFGA